MKEEILLIGGGGHCKACIDVIEAENRFKIAGIVDIREKAYQKVLDYEIIACDEELPDLVKEYKFFLITIGQIKSADKRIEKFEYLKSWGAIFPVIISPSANVSRYASVDEGTIIMHKAFLNANAQVGKNCIINTGAIVEHDATIGDHCHISTGSIVNGECCIGDKTFIGSNTVIAHNIQIHKSTIVGAGSVVINSISENGIYAGNPARRLNKIA